MTEQDKVKRQKIEELLRLLKQDKIGIGVIRSSMSAFGGGLEEAGLESEEEDDEGEITQDELAEEAKRFEKALSARIKQLNEEDYQKRIEIYMKTMSIESVEAALVFYNSEAGKKYRAEIFEAQSQTAPLAANLFARAAEATTAKMAIEDGIDPISGEELEDDDPVPSEVLEALGLPANTEMTLAEAQAYLKAQEVEALEDDSDDLSDIVDRWNP